MRFRLFEDEKHRASAVQPVGLQAAALGIVQVVNSGDISNHCVLSRIKRQKVCPEIRWRHWTFVRFPRGGQATTHGNSKPRFLGRE